MTPVWCVRIYERKWLLVSADVRREGKRGEALRTFAKRLSAVVMLKQSGQGQDAQKNKGFSSAQETNKNKKSFLS